MGECLGGTIELTKWPKKILWPILFPFLEIVFFFAKVPPLKSCHSVSFLGSNEPQRVLDNAPLVKIFNFYILTYFTGENRFTRGGGAKYVGENTAFVMWLHKILQVCYPMVNECFLMW